MPRWTPLDRFQQHEPEAGPPVDLGPVTFDSPAKGDAYDFSVTLHRSAGAAGKRVRGVPHDELLDSETVVQRARQEVRPITRRFDITQAGAAEEAANERLSAISLIGTYRWRVRAEVNVPDEIRELNRQAYRRQHEIRSETMAALLRIRGTDEVRHRWQDFLTGVVGSPRAAEAIQLVHDPAQLPRVIAGLIEQRESGAQELFSVIDRIVQGYQAVDLLDFEVRSENVLRNTLELLGLPVPPLAAQESAQG
ncbi:hypothetical protein [Nonomuraea gerenzanensis]|uniref:Uncharacterized protein n=1 Tax=Nonomuraea gerenzanensis TaxID=93944 RepID=A0A1M4ECG5_9ACTN|nr:hypothetical protein [Nonomuraea gerenzanensis]UBU18519.1 hypothetical protein LCN96_26910 [Nonomuraea gerenzanensis]SBO96358.1 hypothetical protein BN4615_P5874 [Nonomuraea gerenzanensis]